MRAREQQRVVPELHVRGPGDHVPQAGQARVGARAPDVRGQAEPGAVAVLLEQRAERHVVDQRALHRAQGRRPPRARIVRTSMQPPAAAAVPLLRVVDPAERVELGEEVDEGGHDHPLPPGLRAEQRHLRDERRGRRLARRGPGRAARAGAQAMSASVNRTYSGAGPGVPAASRPGRGRQALRHRPDLAAQPSGLGPPLTTVSGAPPSRAAFSPSSAAIAPVPSSLLSSTR